MAQKTIKVKSGDTLSKIAKQAGTTVSAIASANKIKDVNKISIGQSISIPGSTSSSSSSKSSSSSSSSGSDSIRKIQQDINKRGSKVTGFKPIAVDGIIGPNTKREMLRFGLSPSSDSFNKIAASKVTQAINPIRQTQGSSYSTISTRNPSNTSKPPKKKGLIGRAIDDLFSGKNLKDALSFGSNQANAYTGYVNSGIEDTLIKKLIPGVAAATNESYSPYGTDPNAWQPKEEIEQLSPELQAYNQSKIDNQNTSNITDDGIALQTDGSLNPDITGTGGLYTDTTVDEPVVSGGTSGTSTTKETTTIDKPEATTMDMGAQTFAQGSNPGILNNINMANNNFGVNSSSINNPWDVKSDKSEFQGAEVVKYADTASKSFTSPEEAMQYFNTPQGMASIKKFTDAGGKVEDIINRVPKGVNGVVGPQTFQEFEQKLKDLDPTNQAMLNEYANSKLTGFTAQTMDTKNVPAELKGIVDAQNKQLVMQSNFLNEQQKMLYEQATQDKIAAQEERNALQQIADARETAIERKTDILTKQYKADMKAEEAETEMNRITARKNLTEFLAQIGALRTDGNAQLGIETLDQRYQAQKSAIRSKYQTLIGNAQAEADEKISDLQYNLKMNTLELYKDLNKTDREIRMDVMKMKYDYESDVLSYNTKYQEKLSDLREKQKSEANEANDDWRNAYFTLSAGDMFASLPAEFRNQWLVNNQISPEGFKTTQEDLSKDFSNWSKTQTQESFLTKTQIAKTVAYMKNNKASQDDINRFLNSSTEEQSWAASKAGAL